MTPLGLVLVAEQLWGPPLGRAMLCAGLQCLPSPVGQAQGWHTSSAFFPFVT